METVNDFPTMFILIMPDELDNVNTPVIESDESVEYPIYHTIMKLEVDSCVFVETLGNFHVCLPLNQAQ